MAESTERDRERKEEGDRERKRESSITINNLTMYVSEHIDAKVADNRDGRNLIVGNLTLITPGIHERA